MPALGLGLGTKFYRKVGGFKGLLDLYGGSAAAAYSLERLAKDTTNVVRVRRSSDDTEQDFTAAEVIDGTLTTFTGDGDGFVRTWYDQSGNARHAQQTTAASQPQIVSGGALVEVNGKPAIETNTETTGQGFSGIDFSSTTGTGATGFYAANRTDNVSGLWRSTGNSSHHPFSDEQIYDSFFSNTRYVLGGSFAVTEIMRVYSALQTGTMLDARINGVGTTPVAATFARPSAFSIGINSPAPPSSSDFRGQIGAVVIYSSDQSANRAAIEAKLAEIYGITLA